jgi:hypothetical protein
VEHEMKEKLLKSTQNLFGMKTSSDINFNNPITDKQEDCLIEDFDL